MRFTQEREADGQQSLLLDGTGAAIRVAAAVGLSSHNTSQVHCPLGLWRSGHVPPVLGCAAACVSSSTWDQPVLRGGGDSRKWLKQGEGVSSRFEVRFPAEPLAVESSDRGGGTARGCLGTSSCKPALSGEPIHCWAGHLHCWAGNSSLLAPAGRHKGCAGGG